jgi:hypothetical protein
MKDKVIFVIKYIRSDEGIVNEISSFNLEELNEFISEIQRSFLDSVKDNILIKDTITEEFITYKNELGLYVKANVKKYIIRTELLEYLIRLQFLHRNHSSEMKDLFLPFYKRVVKVQKYLLSDITLQINVSIQIQATDNEV